MALTWGAYRSEGYFFVSSLRETVGKVLQPFDLVGLDWVSSLIFWFWPFLRDEKRCYLLARLCGLIWKSRVFFIFFPIGYLKRRGSSLWLISFVWVWKRCSGFVSEIGCADFYSIFDVESVGRRELLFGFHLCSCCEQTLTFIISGSKTPVSSSRCLAVYEHLSCAYFLCSILRSVLKAGFFSLFSSLCAPLFSH